MYDQPSRIAFNASETQENNNGHNNKKIALIALLSEYRKRVGKTPHYGTDFLVVINRVCLLAGEPAELLNGCL